MKSSEWKVTSQFIGEEKMYAVYRIRDISAVDYSGNREYATDYIADRGEALKIVNKLNDSDEPPFIMIDVYSDYPDDDGYYNVIGQRKEYV